jgi:predicted ABC-type sugar transport system permease subunit
LSIVAWLARSAHAAVVSSAIAAFCCVALSVKFTATLVSGALMGLINGLLTAKLLLPSFIVTVATLESFVVSSACRPTAHRR